MAYAVVIVLSFLLMSAVTALRPGRQGFLKMFAFPVGWAAGELAVQALGAVAALLGILWWWGWPVDRWLSLTVFGLGAVVAVANVILIVVQLRSQSTVARAMATATSRPLVIGSPSDDRFGTWWRTLLQVPWHPRSMVILKNIPYGTKKRQRLDVWRLSTTPANAPVIFFVHGGGWTMGDKAEQGRPFLHEMVSRGWIAVTINYHLAPKNLWPAQIHDVVRALGWVKGSISAMGGDPERVVVAGASAGGHLASLLALSADDPTWRPSNMANVTNWKVRGCISFYGVLEMTGRDDVWNGHGVDLRKFLERYIVGQLLSEHPDLYESLSPIERITENAPPFLVVHGGNDTVVDVNVARHFVKKFSSVARAPIYYVELPLTQHAFDVTASPRTSAVTRAAAAFCESVIS